VAKGAVLAPITVILATLTLIWSDTPLWQVDLARLTPVSEEQKLLDQQLRSELGAPNVRDFLVVEGATEEEVLQRCEATMSRLDGAQKENALTGYDVVSRYLPSNRTQQQRRQSLPDRKDLENRLGVASKGLPFAAGLFAEFLDAVDQARSQPFIHRTSFQGTPVRMKIESLLFEWEGRWMAVVPLRGVADRATLKTAIAGWDDPGVTYVDLKEESNQLMTAYRNRAMTLLGWGAIAIAFILAVVLKSPVLLLRVLLPTFCALLVVTAVLNLSGESLSLFHIATFLLVIGLGLDYALFFNRPEGTEAERARTIYGVLVCGTTTILVFGVLAFSTIPVLHAIGMTAAYGSLCCLLFAGLVAEKEDHAT
jgi:predicted exporter